MTRAARFSILAALLSVIVLVAVPAAPAWARTERKLAHAVAKIWPTAVRLLRVDLGLTITDKDEAAGYVVFELHEQGKVYRGTLELIVIDEGTTRAVIQIDDRPDYMETSMLDKLERKLRAETQTAAPPR